MRTRGAKGKVLSMHGPPRGSAAGIIRNPRALGNRTGRNSDGTYFMNRRLLIASVFLSTQYLVERPRVTLMVP